MSLFNQFILHSNTVIDPSLDSTHYTQSKFAAVLVIRAP
jgi:hypothetical protein